MALRRWPEPEERPGIFDGVRVVDTSTGIAGPYATMLLADHGADVVKVEPPGGDPYRSEDGFQTFNRGKRSAEIDLTSESGGSRFELLARSADVVVVDMPQARARALGIDDATLRAGHEDLVYATVPPFGERGPYVDRPASPALLAAANGMMASQMSFSGDPVHLVLPLAAYGTAAMAAAAIAGALYVRERRGIGQFVEVSELAGSVALQVGGVRSDQVPRLPDRVPNPMGSRGRLPAYRLFEAGDGRWFFLACGSPDFFNRMLIATGHTELAADPRLENAPWGLFTPEAIEALAPVLEETFRTQPRDYWIERFAEADVPAQPVQTRDEYFESELAARNRMRAAVDHPKLGLVEMMGVPIVMEAAPGAIRGPAPLRGEHTDEVLGEAIAHRPVRRLHPRHAEGETMLEGIHVLDLTSFIAGPVAARHLAMLGAEVTKVESPGGDVFRQMGLGFLGWNQGKRGIAVDLRTEAGREVVHRLARQADIVVENFRPGVTQRLGVDPETLHALNPELIYVSCPGWGDDDRMAAVPAFDPLVQALSGAMAAQGGDDEPVFHTVALNDVMTPALAAFGTLAALFHRARTGEGQLVRTALARTGLAIQAAEFTRVPGSHAGGPHDRALTTAISGDGDAVGAHAPGRATADGGPRGEERAQIRPRDVGPLAGPGGLDFPGPTAARRWYRCADEEDLYVEAQTREERRALIATAGAAVDVEAASAPYGSQPCSTATAALAAAFRTRPRDEWIAALDEAGVPCIGVVRRGELLAAPHLRENELIVDQPHPLWGMTANAGMLIRASATPGRIDRVAPGLSEHALEVLEELGYSPEERDSLIASGAVRDPGDRPA